MNQYKLTNQIFKARRGLLISVMGYGMTPLMVYGMVYNFIGSP